MWKSRHLEEKEVKESRDQGVPWIIYVNTKITKNQNREGSGEYKNKWGGGLNSSENVKLRGTLQGFTRNRLLCPPPLVGRALSS